MTLVAPLAPAGSFTLVLEGLGRGHAIAIPTLQFEPASERHEDLP